MTQRIQWLDEARLAHLPGSVEHWLRELDRATLLRVPGRDRSRVRIVTTLLHGNEPSGVRAVHAWLRSGVAPATDVVFYIGSVEAALAAPPWSHRALPHARDANRCFSPPFWGLEGERARELIERLEAARPEALLDLHNNSGRSPAYGVGTVADAAHLGLTGLFADRYMLSDLRLGTLIEATERFTASIVVECGRAQDPVADAVALAGLERYLSVEDLSVRAERWQAMEILHRPIRVRVHPDVRLAFGDAPVEGANLTVRSDIDRHNFDPVEPGIVLGWLGPPGTWPFDARGGDGVEVSAELFTSADGLVRIRRAMVPVMMAVSAAIARSDCLFYAMQKR
ncbi:MAG: succinylglutamate desuccinylase [Gammaproteobacteria bacterium]